MCVIDDHEGDNALRCGNCGSRNMMLCNREETDTLYGVCMNCERFQEVETRDWPLSSMCDNCAFRKGSPEQADPFRWAEILETVKKGQPFHCHKGLEATHVGIDISFSPPTENDAKVCAGWRSAQIAHYKRNKEKKDVR